MKFRRKTSAALVTVVTALASAVLGAGAANADTTECYAYPPTQLSTLLAAGDVYLQACVTINGDEAYPSVRITSHGTHYIDYIEVLINNNGTWTDADSIIDPGAGVEITPGYSVTLFGNTGTFPKTGSTYVQGQAEVAIDGYQYDVYSKSLYVG